MSTFRPDKRLSKEKYRENTPEERTQEENKRRTCEAEGVAFLLRVPVYILIRGIQEKSNIRGGDLRKQKGGEWQ